MNPPPDHCPKCGAALAGALCRQCLLLAGMESASCTSDRWTPPTPGELEAQLSKYQVLELIGRGGMGVVYKGWQTSLERGVAIKVLSPALTEEDPALTARFKHEARTMARLSHPAIVSVYDFDETANGLLYIVMELMEGTDVQRMIASQGKLPPHHALAIAMHVCDALTYAHENGIIHRDIKPANVMVDGQGRVKVADFGLAKLANAGPSLLTGTNVTMGTPGYVAPEALIVGETIDARADLYAVGVMLYAMLTGKVPQGRFEPASERVPGLDPRFDDIVNRAMRDEREARYASAMELGADLTTIHAAPMKQAKARLAQDSVHMQREPRIAGREPSLRAPLSSRGSPAGVRMAVVAIVLCAIGFFYWKPQSRPGPPTYPSRPQKTAEASVPQVAAQPPSVAPALQPDTMPEPATPARVAKLSAPSTPAPSTPVPAEPKTLATDVEKWLAQLDASQAEGFQKQVVKPYETGAASLRGRYLAALDAAFAKASAANRLDEALAWRTERRTFEKQQTALAENDGPATVKALRAEFRQELSTLDKNRAVRAKALFAQYDATLAHNQALLTQRLRLDDALLLKKKRDEVAVSWLGSSPSANGAAPGRPQTLQPAPRSGPMPLQSATKEAPWENTLGMRFVPVPITGGPTNGELVLFSVWDTRVQDYEVFVKETNQEWPKPNFPQGPTHPAVMASWDDAQLFCQWLTLRDQAAGRLPPGISYRLPSDHEWSCAVGLGSRENAAKPPSEKNSESEGVYPWGGQWPPPAGAGNYAGEEMRAAVAAGKHTQLKSVLVGYQDGFVETAPVGSFAVDQFGLFDMGGNVWQWCEDWYDQDKKGRVLRGASWDTYHPSNLLSRSRSQWKSGSRHDDGGFRCVLAPVSTLAGAAVAAPPTTSGQGQTIDLLALPDLDLGSPRGANATIVRRIAGQLRIDGDKYTASIRAPVAILGSEYELGAEVGKEFGTAIWMNIPLEKSTVGVRFNSSGMVALWSQQKTDTIIPPGSAWPAAQPITLKLRVKLGAGGKPDELEAKVGHHPGVIWHGRLADYAFKGNSSNSRLGLNVMHDVKTIESFTLRMIQGEAKLLPPAAKSSAPVAGSAPAPPEPETRTGTPVDIKFTAVDGREVDLAKLRGKVVLVDFWATWCKPCLGEAPNVVEAYRRFHDQGFEIVGISFDQDKAALQRVTEQNGMTWPQYFDGKLWQNDYGVKYEIHSIPTMWLIDRQGRVATTNGREDLAGQVEKLLAPAPH